MEIKETHKNMIMDAADDDDNDDGTCNPNYPLLGSAVNATTLEHQHLLASKRVTTTTTTKTTTTKCGSFPMRFLFVGLGCFLCFVVYSTRVCMSIALVCMVNQTAVLQKSHIRNDINGTVKCSSLIVPSHNQTDDGDDDKPNNEDGPFVWEEQLQGIILSSFFWGYIITQFPGGILADKIGGKWILAWCQLATSILTMLVPVASLGSVYIVILLRFLCGMAQGVTFPTLGSLLSNWAPKPERSILMTLTGIGCSIGIIVTFPVSAFLCKSTLGWPAIFYLFGGAGILWFVLWVLCIENKPSEHPWISLEEKTFIETNTMNNRNEVVIIPWGLILRSPAFYSLCLANFTSSFKYFMLLTQLPTYLKVVMDFNLEQLKIIKGRRFDNVDEIKAQTTNVLNSFTETNNSILYAHSSVMTIKNGLINIMPYLLGATTAVFSSIAADYIKNTDKISITSVRKTFCFIGTFCSAIGLIGVPIAGCNRALVISLLWISIGIDGLNAAGLDVISLDMAPKMSGTIIGIANSCSAAGGIVAPYVVGILTQNSNTKSSWDLALYLSSGVCLVGLFTFMLFGSAEIQPWNHSVPAKTEDEDCDTTVLFERTHFEKNYS